MTPQQAVKVLKEIERFNVQFVEQPVSSEDLNGLMEVRRNSPILVMVDESVHSPQDALRLIEAEAVDLINIKLMKSGGILKGRKIAEIAEAAGVPCMMGCMGESGIGIAAGAHLAAAVKNIQYADLDSEIENSMHLFPKYHGLGIEEVYSELLGKPLRIYK